MKAIRYIWRAESPTKKQRGNDRTETHTVHAELSPSENSGYNYAVQQVKDELLNIKSTILTAIAILIEVLTK
ncbi:hypothetical protein MKZ38_010655 [Zalerion maritima]|uniref:Uncharacterized protein n=1 Tax=Zalerion maritima TaxID=339359 RepID=A0AAD5WUZ0_9PEZI|nr:hypothetical protein MKZ38_010655 [Zalerion maritima]